MGETLIGQQARDIEQLGLPIKEIESPSAFHVEGVYVEDGMRVVVYGKVTTASIPQLETVLNGLLLLHPAKLTIEFEAVVDSEALGFLSRYDCELKFPTVDESPTTSHALVVDPMVTSPGLAFGLA